MVTHRGRHYNVDGARIYTLPDSPPPIPVSGFGPRATDLAARIGDAYVTTSPDTELLSRFKEKSGGKPAMIGSKASWAPTKDEGVAHAHGLWRNAGLPGELARHKERHRRQLSPKACGEVPRLGLAFFVPAARLVRVRHGDVEAPRARRAPCLFKALSEQELGAGRRIQPIALLELRAGDFVIALFH